MLPLAERTVAATGLVLALAVCGPAAAEGVRALAPVDDVTAAPEARALPAVRANPTRPAAGSVAPEALKAVPAPVAGPRTRAGRSWPTAGRLVTRFGEDLQGLPSPGVRIAAGFDGTVHAPARGRVVFAEPVARVGLVLIIAHGDEYHSVLVGLGAVDVAVGDAVAAGHEVGRMGPEQGDAALLHLELHHRGRPIDPLPWLGVRVAGDRHS